MATAKHPKVRSSGLFGRVCSKVNRLQFLIIFDFRRRSAENHFADIQHDNSITNTRKKESVFDDEHCLAIPAEVLGPVRLLLFGILLLAAVWYRRDTVFPSKRMI